MTEEETPQETFNKVMEGTPNSMGVKVDEIKPIEPKPTIEIHSPTGKFLKLDFSTDKLIVTGDLKQKEAAKIFFDSLNGFFQEAIKRQTK